MRRAFKPYLRHSLSKRPRPDEGLEVVIVPEWDTVLRYDGSPLMKPSAVADPKEGVNVVPGDHQSYQTLDENGNQRDWIAIGLATDNEQIDEFRSPNPISDDADPDDVVANGLVYTNIGPTRSVLSFNLEAIPPDAEIISAELELVPVTDKSNDDVWNEFDDINNIWPAGGVPCEIHNLVSENVSETCTWNGGDNTVKTVGGLGDFPDQSKRWHNLNETADILPSPFGAIQNSKRWDIQEPVQTFWDTFTGTIPERTQIDSTGTESHGHVGYALLGGGAVENVPKDDDGTPLPDQLGVFRITKGAHDEQIDGDTEVNQDIIDGFKFIDVTRAIRYAHAEQNGTCNLLLRARHWIETDLTEDQTEETFAPPVLSLDSILLEDETDEDDQVEIDHNAIIRFDPATFDEDGNPNTEGDITWTEKAEDDGWDVTYDWQVKYPDITNFPGPDFKVILTRGGTEQEVPVSEADSPVQLIVGDVLTVRDISSGGGFNNRHDFEFFTGGDQAGEENEGDGEVDNGLNEDFEVTADIVPDDDDDVLFVNLRIGARAQGANLINGEFDPNIGAFPSQAITFIGVGFIEEPDEIIDPTITIAFDPEITPDDDFGSPINLSTTHTITITTTISNIRPGFDWNTGSDGTFPGGYANETTIAAFKEGDFSDGFDLSISVQQFVDENSRVATQVVQAQFTGQELLSELSGTNAGDRFQISMNTIYNDAGFDGNGELYIDSAILSENHTFQVSEVNTTNDFDITDPVGRRGVFTTTNLRGPLINDAGAGRIRNFRLAQPDSFVKTNMFQRELAPCQLECNEGGNVSSAQTALLPIEERSRFSEITATKNKFALLDLTEGLQLIFDESDIRDTDGRIPVTQGNNSAVVSLVTSGGAGKMVERRRSGSSTPIFLPSDLAVYYYNDNDGEDDIGWVYYRAISKKLTPASGSNNIPTDAFSDYSSNDFTVRNTDDGLEYVGWEKLSGDSGNLLANINVTDDDPNVGAHLFLLDDRYDFVETPTDLELLDTNKWPVPFSEDFPLGLNSLNGINTPNPSNDPLQARNWPTMFETFLDGEGQAPLSSLSSILSSVQWEIGSLDSGTGNQQNLPSIVRTVEGAAQQNDNEDFWNHQCPAFLGIDTRDSDNKIRPLPDASSLFVCYDDVSNSFEPPESPIKFKSFHSDSDPYFLGSGPQRNNGKPVGVATGKVLDTDSETSEYCNAKSHFWNGLFLDINDQGLEPFTGNDNSGLKGRIPLFWRKRSDCGQNTSESNKYFKDIVINGDRVTSDLDRPLSNPVTQPEDGYHGINIDYGGFHSDYIDSINDPSDATPILEYIVEVIRGGSVYHRDIYRLANAQAEWSQERTIAEQCFPCLRDDRDITEDCSGNAVDAVGGNAFNKADTLYQVGIDGNAWRDGWYNPSDWRAGDIIRIHAIQPRIQGDVLRIPKSTGFGYNTYNVVEGASPPEDGDFTGERDIPPTPPIKRIKKFCPITDWNAEVTYAECCRTVTECGEDTVGKGGPLAEKCCDGRTVCLVVCYNKDGENGIDPNDNDLG